MSKVVLAYLTRIHRGELQVLVGANREHPEEGLCVPSGEVEADERAEEALYREIEEKTGLIYLRFVQKLDSLRHPRAPRRLSREWLFFQLEPANATPYQWTHVVDSFGEADGETYDYFWLSVDKAAQKLPAPYAHALQGISCCKGRERGQA